MAERMAWGHVRRLFPNVCHADKEDMVQEAIVGVWRKGATDPGLVSAVTRTSIIDAARRMFGRYQRARNAISQAVHIDGYENNDRLLGHYDADYTGPDAEAILAQLKPIEREDTLLRVQGYNGEEIAHMRGLHPSRVAQRRMDARRRVRELVTT